MLSPVSFGSTYKTFYDENSKNVANYYSTIGLCDSQKIPYIEDYEVNSCTIVAPDSRDKYLETYMANKGIVFHKLDSEKLNDPIQIGLRVMPAPKGRHKVYIDAEKFEEMLKKTRSNYDHCKLSYKEYFKETLQTQIKSGEQIPATSLFLVPKTCDLIDFINRYGAESVDENMLDAIFDMSHITEDSSMYFAMKDAGMTRIPVYMDKDSTEIANKMGIIAR